MAIGTLVYWVGISYFHHSLSPLKSRSASLLLPSSFPLPQHLHLIQSSSMSHYVSGIRPKMSLGEKQLNKDSPFSKTRPFFLDATETTEDREKTFPSLQNLDPRVLI